MNFKPFLLEKVKSGEKTQTRRLRKPGETMWSHYKRRFDLMVKTPAGRLKWLENNTYSAAPGRGKKGECRIKFKRIREGRACDITEGEAQAEGFASRHDFLNAWDDINGVGNRNADVWIIEFELVRTVQPELMEVS